MKRIFLLFIFIMLAQPAFARHKMLGHLLTPTAYSLEKGHCTAGLLLLGCGVNDRLTMGVSPFLVSFYNMPNLIARFVNHPNRKVRWSFEVRYFKTYEFGRKYYEMEATTAHVTRSVRINKRFTTNVSLSYFHYFNEVQPFSLRMDPRNDDKGQWNLSTLFQVQSSKYFGFNFEVGSIGLNYNQPFMHYGASAYFQSKSWYVQLGISNTVEFALITDYSVQDNNVIFQTSHPEINIQYFF